MEGQHMFKLLKNKNFFYYVCGHGSGLLGTLMLQMGLSLYILDLTGSASKFASALTLGLLPVLLFSLHAGVLVDRINRKKLLIFLDLSRSIVLVGLLIAIMIAPLHYYVIYGLIFLLGIGNVLFNPAFITMLPNIVSKEEIVGANAVKSTIIETISIAGPVLGAFLYSAGNLKYTFIGSAAAFLISAIVTYLIQLNITEKRNLAKERVLHSIKKGFHLYRDDIRLTSLVFNGFLTHIFLTSMFMVGFPFMIKEIFLGTDIDVGIIESVAAIGSLTSVLFIIILKKYSTSISKGILYGLIGMAISITPLLFLSSDSLIDTLTHSRGVLLLFFSVSSLLIYWMRGIYGVYFVSFYQTSIENRMMGRFFSIMAISFALGRIIGFKLFGYLFDYYQSLNVPMIVLLVGMLLKIIVHIPFMKAEKIRELGSYPNQLNATKT